MKALSIQQPWSWLILNAGKDIENRSWSTNLRGRILIHTGQRMDLESYDDLRDLFPMPSIDKFDKGGIVGEVTIVGCVSKSRSSWFYGPYGFVLKDARPLPFRPWRGALGFFDVPDMEQR